MYTTRMYSSLTMSSKSLEQAKERAVADPEGSRKTPQFVINNQLDYDLRRIAADYGMKLSQIVRLLMERLIENSKSNEYVVYTRQGEKETIHASITAKTPEAAYAKAARLHGEDVGVAPIGLCDIKSILRGRARRDAQKAKAPKRKPKRKQRG